MDMTWLPPSDPSITFHVGIAPRLGHVLGSGWGCPSVCPIYHNHLVGEREQLVRHGEVPSDSWGYLIAGERLHPKAQPRELSVDNCPCRKLKFEHTDGVALPREARRARGQTSEPHAKGDCPGR